jgi:hypothetical protein
LPITIRLPSPILQHINGNTHPGGEVALRHDT